jgi:hypothetical protein
VSVLFHFELCQLPVGDIPKYRQDSFSVQRHGTSFIEGKSVGGSN